ncbi:hypothetical protein BGZ99_001400 [Dissophora globulifera]|uniref:Ion transport domain-containing protein n=1 Tax=Dissophora globulifera TaxID=979702 RepID=A0A9P6RNV1_9FUNG|nr:hypothetical protein BGZ99_001400 [Dissophora globulifera]
MKIVTSEWDIKKTPRLLELRLRLHRGFEVFLDATNSYKIVIEIEMRKDIGNATLSFELLALEFCNAYIPRQTIGEHIIFGAKSRPQLFTAVVPGATKNTPVMPVKINAFAISETGSHSAVLHFKDGQGVIIVETLIPTKHHKWSKISGTKIWKLTECGLIATPEQAECLRIAISRGGTQVAIFQSVSDPHLGAKGENATVPLVSEIFPFTVINVSSGQSFRPLSKRVFFQKHIDFELGTFVGFGKFASTPGREELFVSCDGSSVKVHVTKSEWTRLHSIALQSATSSPHSMNQSPIVTLKNLQMANMLIESAQGTYFAWLGNPLAVSIWSMELGRMVSFIADAKLPTAVTRLPTITSIARLSTWKRSPNTIIIRIASHGRYMAIASNSQICKYLLPSGTIVGVTNVSSGLREGSTIIDIWWKGNSLLITYQEDRTLATFLVSLDVERQHWGDRRIVPLNLMEHSLKVRDKVYTVHGSTVDIASVGDLIEVLSSHDDEYDCKRDVASKAVKDSSLLQECTLENGDRFELKTDDSSDTVALLLLSSGGGLLGQWNFIARGWRQLAECDGLDGIRNHCHIKTLPAFILEGTSRFVVTGAGYIQVWQLPTPDLESCRLIVMATAPASTKKDDRAHSASHLMVGQHVQHLTICQHMRYLTVQFGEDEKHTIDMSRDNHDHLVDSKHLKVWSTLVQLYTAKDGNSTYQQALLQYTVQAFKQCPTWDYSKNVFLLRLCKGWEVEGFEEFLQDLVQQPEFKWIPAHPASKYKDNAIVFGIATSWDHTHRNVRFHHTLIKHCIQNAVQEGDTFFLKPIFDCLPLITEERFGLEVMRQMAFIPVPESSHTFVIENSVLSRSNSIFQQPESNSWIKVYDDDVRILRLDRVQKPDPDNKYFKKRLFVAPFDMLYQTKTYNVVKLSWWRYFKASDRNELGVVSGDKHDRKLRKRMAMRIPRFPLQMLDNPTLKALVQYQWNTGGAYFWLKRTVWHFLVFYTILIVQSTPALLGDIIPSGANPTLAMMNAINSRYLPVKVMAAAVYKFRVYHKFCKFLDFIFRLTADIGLFLALFAFGVVAFAQVFWFLIYGCLGTECQESTSRFPKNFIEAIFATYFFLGGRYDPVSTEMDSKFSVFHAVMALYYFFTAIILLNVLIGEFRFNQYSLVQYIPETLTTKLFDRLGYVNAASFSRTHSKAGRKEMTFEREIYFTATDEDILEFHRKHLQKSKNPVHDRVVEERDFTNKITTPKDNQIKEPKDSQIKELKDKVEELREMMAALV